LRGVLEESFGHGDDEPKICRNAETTTTATPSSSTVSARFKLPTPWTSLPSVRPMGWLVLLCLSPHAEEPRPPERRLSVRTRARHFLLRPVQILRCFERATAGPGHTHSAARVRDLQPHWFFARDGVNDLRHAGRATVALDCESHGFRPGRAEKNAGGLAVRRCGGV
jgi:hypothetical protein